MKKRGFAVLSTYQAAGIVLPQRKTTASAGYDLAAAQTVVIEPQTVALVPTGLKAYMQPQEYLGIHIRSGLSIKKKLMLINGQGVIDADYYDNPDNEGHILIAVFNAGRASVTIEAGERIAQGVFYQYLLADDDAGTPVRREGGFGSTGA